MAAGFVGDDGAMCLPPPMPSRMCRCLMHASFPYVNYEHCLPSWFDRGWFCPYVHRPKDLDWQIGESFRVTLRSARTWTGRPGDTESQVFISGSYFGKIFLVCAVHRTPNFTSLQMHDDQTDYPVWMNVWTRHATRGQIVLHSNGVRWAERVTLQ